MKPDDPSPAWRRKVSEVGCVGGPIALAVGGLVREIADLPFWYVGLAVVLTVVGAYGAGRRVTCRHCDRWTYTIGPVPPKCPHCKESWQDDMPTGADPDDTTW